MTTFRVACLLLLTTSASGQFVGNNQKAVDARADQILSSMTLEEKIDLISGDTPFRTHSVPRLHIPYFQMADGPVGAHIPAPTIAYAGGIGLAATWDERLAVRIGEELGRDAKSRGAAMLLGPGINIYRAPMNGRNFEYFGEDPFLSSRITVGYIQGVQHEGVSAVVKHYLGNNSEFMRMESDSVIDERTLREIYMPGFEAAVKEGRVGGIMDAYNFTNGEHMTQNPYLNQVVAKDQWHFQGIIMSDWGATHDTLAAFKSGMDLEMPFGNFFNKETILPLLKSGAITEAELNEKVRRILRVGIDFGWLDHEQMDITIPRYNLAGRDASLKAAEEGAVLLQNTNGVLPLDKNAIKTIAVIGPNATQTVTTGGGSGEVVSFANTSLLVGISNYLGSGAKVLYSRGIYSVNQLASLTDFTTDAEGTKPGITHTIYPQVKLQGTPTGETIERHIAAAGSNRRDPEIQELNALTSHKSASTYVAVRSSSQWLGYYTPKSPGKFIVFANANGKFRLLIDEKVIFDNSVISKFILNQTTMDLTSGPHKIVFEELQTQFGSVSGSQVGIAPVEGLVDPHALEMAKSADAVVLAVGFNNRSETEGGDRSFDLPAGQDQLIDAVAGVGKKTIVMISAGGSVNISPWKDKVQGIFATWYAGEEGGTAAARLLFGEVNPSGHLPISWEKQMTDNPTYANYYPDAGTSKIIYREGIFVGYRGYEKNKVEPQFPFGFGLSYTSFSFGKPHVETTGQGMYDVSFDVKNTGKRAGATVAQAYVGEVAPAVERPAKELKAFERVELQPGETRRVTLHLNARSFSYYDTTLKTWKADSGEYKVMIGDSSKDILQTTTVKLPAPIVTPVEN